MKKKFLILGSAFLATSITLAAAALVTPEKASAADYNTTTVTTVATVEGASVRILAADDEYKGLRFGAYVNTEWYQDGYEAGFLLYEGEASAPITHETVGAVECPSLVWQTATDYAVEGLDFYTAVIAGIDVSDNATVLTARAYVETAEGTYTYADTQVSSSVAEAASKALASGKYTQYETELNGYLEGVSWTVTVNGATQLVAHGQKAVAPATPTMEGYTFAGWTANGKAFDFATDVITLDTTVEATWTGNYQTVYDFEEETVNMDLLSYNGTLPDSTFAVSNAQAKSGNQSLLYHNGMSEGNVYVIIRFTDETLSMIDENDGLKLSLFVEKTVSAMTSFNVRIRPYDFKLAGSNEAFGSNWITHTNGYTNFSEWLTFDENGGFATPSAIMADIKAGGGVAVCIEHHNGEVEGQRAYNLYIDDVEIVKNYSVTEDFEGANVAVTSAGVTADTLTLTNGYGSGAFSLSSDAYSGSRAIARQIDATAVYTRLTFGTRMLAAINPENTMIRFRLKIVPNASEPNAGVATGAAGTTYAYYNLRFYKSAPAHSNSYGYYDTVTTNQWIEFFINDSASLTEIKSEGFFSIVTEVKNSQLSTNYCTLLIDDVDILTGMGDGNETFTHATSLDTETYQVKVNTGTLTGSAFDGSLVGMECLLMENAQDQSYTTFVIKVPESAKKGTTRISLMLNINPHGCNATSYNVRIRGANAVEGSNQLTGHTGGKGWVAYADTVPTRTLLFYELTDAEGIAAIVACDYLIVAIEMKGNTTENYRLSIDNIRFENESEHTAASVDVAAEIASRVSENAKVSEIVVKNAAGETVALTDGKITAAGEYVITAKIVENGVTKTFTMKVIV